MGDYDVRLTRTEKNRVFEILHNVSLPLIEFGWQEDPNYIEEIAFEAHINAASTLTHNPSGYFYTFGRRLDRYSPGKMERTETSNCTSTSPAAKNAYRAHSLTGWAKRLKEEIEAPDLWAELFDGQSLAVATSSPMGGVLFTEQEKQYVRGELDRIATSIVEQITEAQAKALHVAVEDLKDDLDNHISKKDWINQAVGFLLNVMVSTGFNPEVAHNVYNMLAGAVAPLLGAAKHFLQ